MPKPRTLDADLQRLCLAVDKAIAKTPMNATKLQCMLALAPLSAIERDKLIRRVQEMGE